MDSRVEFGDSETRHDEMHSTIDEWLDDLVTLIDESKASQQFQKWSLHQLRLDKRLTAPYSSFSRPDGTGGTTSGGRAFILQENVWAYSLTDESW